MTHQTRFLSILSMLLAASLAFAATASAHEITGTAAIIDGDTIDIGNQRIRLAGIDAPEIAQTCERDGQSWRCGQAAASELRKLTGGQTVRCEETGRDDYGRALAVCFATNNNTNINEELVKRGFAWAFVKYSSEYAAVETQARSDGVGVWQGTALAPWDYRAGRWQTAETQAPEGCAIKGNISDQGRIYHMPWSPWYARVRVNEANGERWFCSESDATAAGWRAVGGS